MNKKKTLLLIVLFFLLFSLFISYSVIAANTNKIIITDKYLNTNKEENTSSSYLTKQDIELNSIQQEQLKFAVEKYVPFLFGSTNNKLLTISDMELFKVEKVNDKIENQNYYKLYNNNFKISFTEDYNLKSFSDSTFDYSLVSSNDKEMAKQFILNFYKKLDINPQYELAYLGRFNKKLWEADFARKSDNIYDYYNSVKILFSPEQQKIAALTVHTSDYDSEKSVIYQKNISEEKAVQITIDKFEDITIDNIVDSKLLFTKPNNFFDIHLDEQFMQTDTSVKAWEITIEKNNIKLFVYIDYITGKIIGGDKLK